MSQSSGRYGSSLATTVRIDIWEYKRKRLTQVWYGNVGSLGGGEVESPQLA